MRSLPSKTEDPVVWGIVNQAELLRDVLSYALKQEDAGKLASSLIEKFGSLPDALSASVLRLKEVDGVTDELAAQLKTIKKIAVGMARHRIKPDRPVLSTHFEVRDYLHVTMAFEDVEQTRILFMDTRQRLIADETLYRGTINHTALYPREVVRRALDLSASSMLVAHNHPSGDPSPSASDVAQTRELVQAAAVFGIRVHDHIIVGRSGQISLSALKLLG